MEIMQIRELARKFSKELTTIVKRDNIVPLGGNREMCFPMGGCSMASRMFGKFHRDRTVVTYVVKGAHRDNQKYEHTWLELEHECCTIDLTCCQFDRFDTIPARLHECPFAPT